MRPDVGVRQPGLHGDAVEPDSPRERQPFRRRHRYRRCAAGRNLAPGRWVATSRVRARRQRRACRDEPTRERPFTDGDGNRNVGTSIGLISVEEPPAGAANPSRPPMSAVRAERLSSPPPARSSLWIRCRYRRRRSSQTRASPWRVAPCPVERRVGGPGSRSVPRGGRRG